MKYTLLSSRVIPAKAGTQSHKRGLFGSILHFLSSRLSYWVPAFAGMNRKGMEYSLLSPLLFLVLTHTAEADGPPIKPFQNLIAQQTIPQPNQALYDECLKWYDIKHKNMSAFYWNYALTKDDF